MNTLTKQRTITRAGLVIAALMIAEYEQGFASARAARHARKANER